NLAKSSAPIDNSIACRHAVMTFHPALRIRSQGTSHDGPRESRANDWFHGIDELGQRFRSSNHIDAIYQPRPEEPAKRASRRTAAGETVPAAILRDGRAKSAASSGRGPRVIRQRGSHSGVSSYDVKASKSESHAVHGESRQSKSARLPADGGSGVPGGVAAHP